MAGKAAVIGSGIGGGTAAMVLSAAGWQVVVFEKGVNHFTDLTAASPGTLYANDELKSRRAFGLADPLVDPAHSAEAPPRPPPAWSGWSIPCRPRWAAARSSGTRRPPGSGTSTSPSTARSGRSPAPTSPIGRSPTPSWHPGMAKPRRILGVQGDLDGLPARPTLAHAPRSGPFAMPPGPAQYGSLLAAAGARAIGLHPFPFPMAINSVDHDGAARLQRLRPVQRLRLPHPGPRRRPRPAAAGAAHRAGRTAHEMLRPPG